MKENIYIQKNSVISNTISNTFNMTQPTKDTQEDQGKPEVGASGRKIIYDKDGKPYV